MGRTATSIIKAGYVASRPRRDPRHHQSELHQESHRDEIEAYYTLQALPNFIEGIAVIEDEFEGLSLDLVDRLWGGVIIRAWERWSMAVEWVREESQATAADRAFENFERLAKSLAAKREVTAGAEAAQ